MTFCIVEPKTAEQLLARLTRVEKLRIRAATPDGLEYIRQVDCASDGPPSVEAMLEVQRSLNESYRACDSNPTFRVSW